MENDGRELTESPEDSTKSAIPPQAKVRPLWKDLLSLVIKAAMVVLFIYVVFTYVFGVTEGNGMMAPSIKAGDLVLYYRLDKEFSAGDVLVYADGDKKAEEYRVVAVEGDTVDIKDGVLSINGYAQQESYLDTNEKTEAWEDGTRFPITVGKGQVFVLSDSRNEAKDSRIFGCIDIESIKGKVVVVIRRRNI